MTEQEKADVRNNYIRYINETKIRPTSDGMMVYSPDEGWTEVVNGSHVLRKQYNSMIEQIGKMSDEDYQKVVSDPGFRQWHEPQVARESSTSRLQQISNNPWGDFDKFAAQQAPIVERQADIANRLGQLQRAQALRDIAAQASMAQRGGYNPALARASIMQQARAGNQIQNQLGAQFQAQRTAEMQNQRNAYLQGMGQAIQANLGNINADAANQARQMQQEQFRLQQVEKNRGPNFLDIAGTALGAGGSLLGLGNSAKSLLGGGGATAAASQVPAWAAEGSSSFVGPMPSGY